MMINVCPYLKVFSPLAICALFACSEAETFELKGDEPNFLIVITDDHRYDAIGVVQKEQGTKGRYPWLTTPNLDLLAAEGVRFRNAFVVTSLCSPSRASILTGQYARRHGIRDNSTPFHSTTFVNDMTRNGYETAYFGKYDIGQQTGIGPPGFSYSFSFVGAGGYFDREFQENGTFVPTEGWVDHVSTNALIARLKTQTTAKAPFCFMIGYKTAHGPWNNTPEGFDHLYQDMKIRKVPSTESPAVYASLTEDYEDSESYSKKFYQQDLNYFRCITAVDYNIGKIIRTLDSLRLDKNTVIIFLSDNGFYHGEHGLRDKRSAYEESIRIPLIIKGPGIPKSKTYNELALNIDIAPTIYQLTGIPATIKTQGSSLTNVFDQKGNWRDAFLYEYFKEPIGPPTNIFAIRSEDYKLIAYPGYEAWTEFFDLQNDPYETNNLITNKDYAEVVSELKDKGMELLRNLH